jgi:hypothetical protein
MTTQTSATFARRTLRRDRRRLIRFSVPMALSLTVLVACSSGEGMFGPGDGDRGNSPRTDVPNELLGAWYTGNVSPSSFYNPNTGLGWTSGYGTGEFYRFSEDGEYEFGWMASSFAWGCGTRSLVYLRGTVEVDEAASTITVHPTSGRALEERGCPEHRDERELSDDELEDFKDVLTYGFAEDEFGTMKLWMRGADHGEVLGYLPEDE